LGRKKTVEGKKMKTEKKGKVNAELQEKERLSTGGRRLRRKKNS